VNVVFSLLGDSPGSEFYVPTFRNTISVPLSRPIKMEKSVPKRRHIKFGCRGITQKKEYNRKDLQLGGMTKVYRDKLN
jgi:hypothetical protein